jgi:hypothetical protein
MHHLPTPMRIACAMLGLLLAFLAFEVPAAAHFGAAHVTPPLVIMAAEVTAEPEHSGALTVVVEALDCADGCAGCTSGAMHGHCHAPAVLSARAEVARHAPAVGAAWGPMALIVPAAAAGTPPVPPPNAA